MQLSVAPLSWAFRLPAIFITSHVQLACAPLIRASPLQFLVAPLSGASPLHWSSVPLICISSAPLHLTSHVQLAFAPHILLIASLIAPLTCTSDLHLLQHLSIAYLSCTYHVRHAASHLGYKSQLHFSVSSLIWTSQFLLLIAPLGCISYLHILCTSAPLRCMFQLDFQSQALSSRLSCASRVASSTLLENLG